MRRILKVVVWVLVVSLCLPVHVMALGGISEGSNIDDVVAVLVYDGIAYELDSMELNELELNGLETFVEENDISTTMAVADQIEPRNQPGDINTYYEETGKDVLKYDMAVYVTPEFQGPCDLSYGESRTITSTFSGSFSLSIKKIIAVDAGGSYSVSSNKDFGATFPVKEFETARIQFVPRMRHTVGTYCYDSFTCYDVDAYIAKKVNGFADGLYRKVVTGVG